MNPGEIQKHYSTEMALVILMSNVYFKRATANEVSNFIAENKVDWALFEQIIAAHQIRPFVFKVLSANIEGVDAGFLEQLRKKCFAIAGANLRHLEEMVRLHLLLTDNGILNIPYKGVLLSQFLFGDYISRETSDIDFLIDKKNFGRTHTLLLKEGYNPRFYNPDFERQFLNTSHELLYRSQAAPGAIKIEIHWAATSNMMNIPLPTEYLFRDLQSIKLMGKDTVIFNAHNHLLVLLVHHGVNDVWRSLRHIIDIAVFLEKYSNLIDWAAFYKDTVRFRIYHTTVTGFQLAEQLFGTAIPPVFSTTTPLPDGIPDNLLRFPSLRKQKLNFENLSQQLYLRDSAGDKIALLSSYLYAGITTNVRDMEAYHVPKGWYGLYYFLKPFRMIFGRRK